LAIFARIETMLLIRKQQLQNVRCYSLINKMHIGVNVLDLGVTYFHFLTHFAKLSSSPAYSSNHYRIGLSNVLLSLQKISCCQLQELSFATSCTYFHSQVYSILSFPLPKLTNDNCHTIKNVWNDYNLVQTVKLNKRECMFKNKCNA